MITTDGKWLFAVRGDDGIIPFSDVDGLSAGVTACNGTPFEIVESVLTWDAETDDLLPYQEIVARFPAGTSLMKTTHDFVKSQESTYTRGDCWYLALAMHRATGMDLAVLAEDDPLEGHDAYHAFVTDGERYFGIRGVLGPNDQWDERIRGQGRHQIWEIGEDDFLAILDFEPDEQDIRRAEIVAYIAYPDVMVAKPRMTP